MGRCLACQMLNVAVRASHREIAGGGAPGKYSQQLLNGAYVRCHGSLVVLKRFLQTEFTVVANTYPNVNEKACTPESKNSI